MGHRDEMFRQMRSWLTEGFRVAVACDTQAELGTFRELLPEDIEPSIELVTLPISDGFILRDSSAGDIAFLVKKAAEHPQKTRKGKEFPRRRGAGLLGELQPGNYIVRREYGIGMFLGLRRVSVAGGDADCLEVVYRDGDKLLVPLEEIGQLQKYLRPRGRGPPAGQDRRHILEQEALQGKEEGP